MTASVTRIDYTQPVPDGGTVVVARIEAKDQDVRTKGPAQPGVLGTMVPTYTVERRPVWTLEVMPDATTWQTAMLGRLWERNPMRTEARTVADATACVEAVGMAVWSHLTSARELADQLGKRIDVAVSKVGVAQDTLLDVGTGSTTQVEAPPYLLDPEPAEGPLCPVCDAPLTHAGATCPDARLAAHRAGELEREPKRVPGSPQPNGSLADPATWK